MFMKEENLIFNEGGFTIPLNPNIQMLGKHYKYICVCVCVCVCKFSATFSVIFYQ
jgi:hypothetical protein